MKYCSQDAAVFEADSSHCAANKISALELLRDTSQPIAAVKYLSNWNFTLGRLMAWFSESCDLFAVGKRRFAQSCEVVQVSYAPYLAAPFCSFCLSIPGAA